MSFKTALKFLKMTKKISKTLSVFSITLLIGTVFFVNTNDISNDNSVTLENIVSLNQAQAETPGCYSYSCALVSAEVCYEQVHPYYERHIGWLTGVRYGPC